MAWPKGRKQTPEHVARALAKRLATNKSPEFRAKMSEITKGRTWSEEHRAEHTAMLTERMNRPEVKAKFSARWRGENNPTWVGDQANYRTLHLRLTRNRGRASTHGCVDCGQAAEQWSQTHGTTGLELDHYEPRCIVCHSRYDNRIENIRRGQLSGKAPVDALPGSV